MAAIAISVPDAPKRTPQPQPYIELKRRVEAAGLMRKRPVYYALMLITNAIRTFMFVSHGSRSEGRADAAACRPRE